MKKNKDIKGNTKSHLMFLDLQAYKNTLTEQNSLFSLKDNDLLDEREIKDLIVVTIATDKQYMAWVLSTKYGISNRAISIYMGVSDACVSNYLKDVERKINLAVFKFEKLEDFKDKIFDVAQEINSIVLKKM